MAAINVALSALLGLAGGSVVNGISLRFPDPHQLRQPPKVRRLFLHGLTAALFAAVAIRFPGTLAVAPYSLGFAGLVALSTIDIDTHLLPKRVVWPLAAIVLVGFVATAAVEGSWDSLSRALLGVVASVVALGLLWFVYPKGMGFGDVRLQVVLGMLTGWVSRGTVAAGLLLAFLAGGIASLALLAARLRSRQDAIPFGPWLCLGCALAVLWPSSGRWLETNYLTPLAQILRALR